MGLWIAIGCTVCALGLAGLHLTVLRWRTPRPVPVSGQALPAVSVVVAARNAYDHILKNLIGWTDQDYPDFEIVIVDDHSEASEHEKLNALCDPHPHVRLIRSTGPQGKKHALRQGISAARGPWILVSDADCRPLSGSWIRTMVAAAGHPGLVLGYSPYRERNDELNERIRFETVMTAMQYMGWAMAGSPYMGVGRNMAFPRDWFVAADPLAPQIGVPYGDDDAIVQAAAGHIPVHVCLDPAAFVQTEPARSRKEWKAQKHRHLSAGHQYSAAARWRAMLMPALLPGAWIFFLLTPWVFTWAWIIGLVSLILRWINVVRWNRGLGNRMNPWYYPAYEIAYLENLLVIAFYAIVKPKKTWN